MRRISGFTLIELVMVILLIGILAAYALPRWIGQGGFEAKTARDEVVARLRLVQSLNMQEPGDRCSWWVAQGNRFAHLTLQPCAVPPPLASWTPAQLSRGRLVAVSDGVAIAAGQSLQLRFDRQGRPLDSCQNGCQLAITGGGESLTLAIDAEGYIHALD